MFGGGLNRTAKPVAFTSVPSKEAGEELPHGGTATWRNSVSMAPSGVLIKIQPLRPKMAVREKSTVWNI